MANEHGHGETRQEQRERMQQHGAGLRRNVTDSALRMAQRLVNRKRRR
jgi:hypothetical protein